MIEIANNGEVPVEAFTLMGASTKRGDDTKIGYFGSGLKYAISKLTKDGVDLKIYSGKKEIKITTTNVSLGREKFKRININKRPTSLTTEMGPDWELWQAIREIYCNAADEEGHKVSTQEHILT